MGPEPDRSTGWLAYLSVSAFVVPRVRPRSREPDATTQASGGEAAQLPVPSDSQFDALPREIKELIYKQMPEWCLSQWRSISTTTRDAVAAGSVHFAPQWYVTGWGTMPLDALSSLPDVAEQLSTVRGCCACCATCVTLSSHH